jgi:hypothetical protein
MGKRKRQPARDDLVSRAVSAGRRALREAESRVPPDLRRQLQRRLREADKNARAAIKQLQAQVQKASTRADVNSVLKRIDGLANQARQIIGGGSAPAPAKRATRRATTTTRRPATRTRKAATPTKRTTARRAPRKKAATPAAAESMAPPPSGPTAGNGS